MLVGLVLFYLGAFSTEGESAIATSCVYKRGKKLCKSERQEAAGCTINLGTYAPPFPPLIYKSNGLVMPHNLDGSRIVTFATGEPITLACPGVGNYLTSTATTTASATCSSGTSVQIGGAFFDLQTLSCLKAAKEVIKETGICGAARTGTYISIGWDIGGTFKEQIGVCHIKSTMNSLYAVAVLNGTGIGAKDLGDARPSFKKGAYYPGVAVDTHYSQTSQQTIFNSMFGATLGPMYLDVGKSLYFARGHFSPEADFVWNVMQDATFYYINAAPQYQAFNNGNWKYLEMAVRDFASAANTDLKVYTGSNGVLSLKDASGLDKPVYLGKDTNGNQILPAPKFYWKVVHDPVAKQATAFVGINNPFLTSLPADYVLCNDVCSSVTWAPKARTNFAQGYTYCCNIAELRSQIPDIPDLGSISLLL